MERVFATKGQAREQSLLIFLMYISIEDIGNLQVQRRTPECSCLTSLFVASVLAFILVLYPKARTWLLAQNAICASTKIVSQALRWVRSSRYINSPQPTLSEHRVHHTSSSTQILHIPYLGLLLLVDKQTEHICLPFQGKCVRENTKLKSYSQGNHFSPPSWDTASLLESI